MTAAGRSSDAPRKIALGLSTGSGLHAGGSSAAPSGDSRHETGSSRPRGLWELPQVLYRVADIGPKWPEDGQALRSAAQPMAVGAVRKPRPAQGQRQAQVILGGVEPVQQPGVPGRQTSPPASQGRAGRDHPGRCRAAGGICARAARPARGRPDARFRRRDRRPAGTGNAAPRQAGRAYAPATPGRGRQNTIAAHRPGGGLWRGKFRRRCRAACRTTNW